MQFPVSIGLHRSRFIDAAVLVFALLASFATLLTSGPVLSHTLLVFLVCFLAGVAWFRLTPQIQAIRLEQTGQISVLPLAKGDFEPAELLPDATIHPWLTVFRLKLESGPIVTVMLTPGWNMPSSTVNLKNRQNFRKLRVFLRWQKNFSALKNDV